MLFGRSSSLVGLDIGSSSVKAVEFTRSGSNLFISGMGSAPIESPETIGDSIQKVLRDAGIKSKRCATAVSGRSVIIRQVPMQQIPDADLRQAVEYAADKYIPFDVNEVQLDVQRLASDGADLPAGQTKVLLVAAKRTLIDEHVALLQSLGLKPGLVDVDVFALGNAFELRNQLLGINDQEVRALVDIGAAKTNINILRGNTSFFQREIYLAGNDLTEAVAKRFGEDPKDVERMKKDPGGALESMQDAMLPILEDIGSEIRLSFDYFENQYSQQVKEVYLSGGSASFPGMDTMFTHVFNLPTKLWDPTEGLELSGFNPSGMGGANSDMAIAVGLASRLVNTMGVKVTSVVPASIGSTTRSETGGGAHTTTVHMEMPSAKSSATAAAVQAGAGKYWAMGIAIALAASLPIAAALAFFNYFGYTQWWVVGEGLPLGIAIGLGLWQGVKRLKTAPAPFAMVAAPLLASLICCGSLLGVRMLRDNGSALKQRPAASAVIQPVMAGGQKISLDQMNASAAAMLDIQAKQPDADKAQIERERATLKAPLAEKPHSLNLNDLDALMFVLGHLLVTNLVGLGILSSKIKGMPQG